MKGEQTNGPKVGIIGGGMMGLATAFYLSQTNMKVSVFEQEGTAGGMSRSETMIPGLTWDRFYHVILPTDEELLRFLDEIGLSGEVVFHETKTGFYTDGSIHSMSSTREFLTFRPLSLWNKLRLAAGILYASRLENSPGLEGTPARAWLIKVFGRTNYEKLWGPLLTSKLGSENSRIAASFIWAYIHRLYRTRKKGTKREMMGCVEGGYHSILGRLQERLAGRSVDILTDHEIVGIEALPNGRIGLRSADGARFDLDFVISTVPNPRVVRFWPDMPEAFRNLLNRVRYLKLVCASLLLKKPLSPYYVMNLTDPGFPFTGLVEASHLIPRALLAGRGLLYLPRYMSPDDDFYEKPPREIMDIFTESLGRIFPGFSPDDVAAFVVHKEPYVQPIQEVDYSTKIPPVETPMKNLFLVNTSMIVNSSLNNNEVVALARRGAELVLHQASGR